MSPSICVLSVHIQWLWKMNWKSLIVFITIEFLVKLNKKSQSFPDALAFVLEIKQSDFLPKTNKIKRWTLWNKNKAVQWWIEDRTAFFSFRVICLFLYRYIYIIHAHISSSLCTTSFCLPVWTLCMSNFQQSPLTQSIKMYPWEVDGKSVSNSRRCWASRNWETTNLSSC